MNRKSRPANADVVFQWLSCVAVVIAMSCAPLSASTVGGKLVTNNTPSYVATAKNLGAEDSAKVIEVSIWLQLHNRSQFDALTQSLYDRSFLQLPSLAETERHRCPLRANGARSEDSAAVFCGAQSYGGEDGSQ